MKTSIRTAPVLFVSLACAAMLGFSGPAQAREKSEKAANAKKVLVVYYSRSGNTKQMAGYIKEMMGGDTVELIPETPYPAEYRATTAQAKRELEADFKPALKTKVKNLKSYDIVFVGTPNWWNSVSGPLRTFLSEYDLSGKTVVPFVTHAGSGMGGIQADVAALCPKSTVLQGKALWGSSVKEEREDVADWLRKIQLLK